MVDISGINKSEIDKAGKDKSEIDKTGIKKNEDYVIEITGMAHDGQGIGKIGSYTVFVEGAIKDETVEIKLIKVNKSYGVGKLLKILKPSSARVQPFCGVFKRCGGCSLQHMDYKTQLEFKTNLVRDSIERIGKLRDVIIHETIGMQTPMAYRNKAQYPVAEGKKGPVIGFYAKRTHDVIDNDICGIQDTLSSKVKEVVREFAARKKISIYDETTGKGIIRHVMTRVGFKTGEIMVVLVINAQELPGSEELVKSLISKVPGIKSIVLNVNTEKTNIILGDKNIFIYGSTTITDYIGKFKFHISPLAFFQVNPVQTEVLYEKALDYAALSGNETVFDLYCGIGTIALFLSQKAGKVYGVEVVEDAVRDARRNAEVNGVTNTEFLVGEAEKVVPGLYAQGVRADVVVVDPPRKGCDEALLKTLADMKPERIVYVSCNPATLARDLRYLEDNGFKTMEVQPVDMFPWTGHVETIILMSGVE